MTNADFTNLTRKQLIKHFEQERQELLANGMNEANIFRIHFGEPDENGKGGDYRMWLDEYNHNRHKSVSMEDVEYEGEWFSDSNKERKNLDFSIDIMAKLAMLTELQRRCVTHVYLYGYSCTELARKDGVTEAAIRNRLNKAKKKFENFFD